MSKGIINSTSYTKKLWDDLVKARPEFGSKPKLRKWNGQWECLGHGVSCLGDTPGKAYANWECYRDLVRGHI